MFATLNAEIESFAFQLYSLNIWPLDLYVTVLCAKIIHELLKNKTYQNVF